MRSRVSDTSLSSLSWRLRKRAARGAQAGGRAVEGSAWPRQGVAGPRGGRRCVGVGGGALGEAVPRRRRASRVKLEPWFASLGGGVGVTQAAWGWVAPGNVPVCGSLGN